MKTQQALPVYTFKAIEIPDPAELRRQKRPEVEIQTALATFARKLSDLADQEYCAVHLVAGQVLLAGKVDRIMVVETEIPTQAVTPAGLVVPAASLRPGPARADGRGR